MKIWRKLSRQTLLKHPRLNVYEDEVELPDGHKTKYIHFGKHHDAATIIALRQDGKILVQKEYSYPPNEWLFQFPGGALDSGETPEQGALRELAEEAGVTGATRSIGKYYMDNRRRADLMHVFVATDLAEAKAQMDVEESFETFWFSPQEIEQMIKNGEVSNYSMLAAWAFYKATGK